MLIPGMKDMGEKHLMGIRATVLFVLYNNFDKAEPTVCSLEEQLDCSDVELIISDDCSGSYDTSLLQGLKDRLADRFADVRINVNETNMGSVAHFNKLFKMVRGKYILFCSPGDRFPAASAISGIIKDFEKSGAMILTGRRCDRYADHSKLRPGIFTALGLKLCPAVLMNYMVRHRNLISSCSTAYSKELFEKYGCLDEDYRLLDDFPFIVSLLKRGCRIAYTGRIFLEHDMGSGVSTGESIHPIILKDLELMQEKLLKDPKGLSKASIRYLEEAVSKRG